MSWCAAHPRRDRCRPPLEAALARYAGKPVGVLVRTPAEMAGVLAGNPFPDAAPNRTVAIFLDQSPPPEALLSASGRAGEELVLGTREIYVHYGDGMANSKLKIPAAKTGTARNINTIAKLVEIAGHQPVQNGAAERVSVGFPPCEASARPRHRFRPDEKARRSLDGLLGHHAAPGA